MPSRIPWTSQEAVSVLLFSDSVGSKNNWELGMGSEPVWKISGPRDAHLNYFLEKTKNSLLHYRELINLVWMFLQIFYFVNNQKNLIFEFLKFEQLIALSRYESLKIVKID